jgi:DNA polymerase
MLIGEGPSGEEDKEGRPFVGPSGRVLDQLLWNNGIDREETFVTNIVRVWQGYGVKTAWEDVETWSYEMEKEVLKVQPTYIGLVGAWAVRWFFAEENVRLDWAHGLPFVRGDYTVMPIFHPANVFNSPETSPKLVSDFQQFAAMIKGRLKCQELTDTIIPHYEELLKSEQVYVVWRHDARKIYVDTEGWYFNPWGLSFAFEPGQGWVIHHESKDAIKRFCDLIQKSGMTVVMHNSMHDIEVLDALGLHAGTYQFEDTMVKAYQLCVEEQGLKPLAKRHCGMDQMEYEEVMAEAEYKKAMEYLQKVRHWCLNNRSYNELIASLKPLKPKKPSRARAGAKSQMTMKFRD